MDGFNDVYKLYLATCLRICSTPEVDNIESKRMHVDAMTEKRKVSFAKECKRLLDISNEVGTKGDKKHVKRESKSHL